MRHNYLYACLYSTEDGYNGFSDGFYKPKRKILREKDLIELKMHIEKSLKLDIGTLSMIAITNLTYTGKIK